MLQVVIAAVVVVVAIALGLVLRSRQAVAMPTQPSLDVPAQLDRSDFPDATAPWMVAVFSSASCHACDDVIRKAQVLESSQVSVIEVEFTQHRTLHHKYGIESVPLVAIADAQGVVRRGFAGPVSATDLWAAVAEAREPGTSPEPELGH
jgi:hypothetical protein